MAFCLLPPLLPLTPNKKQGYDKTCIGPSPGLDKHVQIVGLGRSLTGVGVLFLLGASPAQASLLHGEALDAMAEVISWLVMIVVPVVLIAVFWLVHILPEKIAEKRHHPQAKAIQVLCLLSLFFGGLLWPLAWLWAYTKPVLHKLAYGTDRADEEGHGHLENQEVAALRQRIADLEAQQSGEKGS